MSNGRLEQRREPVGAQPVDKEIADRWEAAKLREDVPNGGRVGIGGPVGAEQQERAAVAEAREPEREQHCVAVGPLKVIEHEQQRSVPRGTPKEVGDRLEEKPSARLGIDCLSLDPPIGVGSWRSLGGERAVGAWCRTSRRLGASKLECSRWWRVSAW
jgi:hypothetical protein